MKIDTDHKAQIALAMPPPISANNLFHNVPGKGRVKTLEYKAWRKAAADMLAIQRSGKFPGVVSLTFYVGETGVGQMDIGNAEKAYTDALVNAGIIKDDSRKWVRSIRSTWVNGLRGCVAVIEALPQEHNKDEVAELIPKGFREILR